MRLQASLVLAAALALDAAGSVAQGTTTAFEGSRVIIGDGSVPIANATMIVAGGCITQVGPPSNVKVPPGASGVNLAGKTVMLTIVDAHVHLGTTRETLLTDLRRRAYLSVSAAFSTGSDAAGSRTPFTHEPVLADETRQGHRKLKKQRRFSVSRIGIEPLRSRTAT